MIRSFYFNRIIFYLLTAGAVIFIAAYFFPFLFIAGIVLLCLISLTVLVDTVLLYFGSRGINAERITRDKFSLGDFNNVVLRIVNHYAFPVHLTIIDELPAQFQARGWKRECRIDGEKQFDLEYKLKPLTRGEYNFGNINIYADSPLRFVQRRFTIKQKQTVKVYPSYHQMRRFQILAVSNRLQEAGVKKIRRLGHSMEFEQIKEYVRGDDFRTINWKATARRGDLMVNNYTDERSQQIYCIINKGRVMKMPFQGMHLLDYAINAALVLSNVALVKQDKAGLITFAESIDAFVPADKKAGQISLFLETLYKQKTRFLEPDMEKLYSLIRHRITQRSLLILFTNYESIESLQRELPSLKRIARYHLLLVVIFENTELKQLRERRAGTLEDIYIKTIAEKFAFEKKLMIKELQKNGILSILTSPEGLTINTINKYLEVKNRLSI